MLASAQGQCRTALGKGNFRKFGLVDNLTFFAGLLIIVLPWLEVIGTKL